MNRSGESMSFTGWQKVTINTPNGTVEGIAHVIISASRAMAISDFYPDWLLYLLKAGYHHPYQNQQIYPEIAIFILTFHIFYIIICHS
jgi:hypothetical protein